MCGLGPARAWGEDLPVGGDPGLALLQASTHTGHPRATASLGSCRAGAPANGKGELHLPRVWDFMALVVPLRW